MNSRHFNFGLAALAVLGSLCVYIATSQFGPGLSTDGARYLSTAESLAAGGGLIDYLGEPLINWPPLYPAILAVLHAISGADVMLLAQIVNIVSFGAVIALSGVFILRALPGQYTFALLASLIVATCVPLLEVSANVASDPLFMLCVLLWLLAAQQYVARRAPRHFWQMVALAAAACYLRYAGAALVMSGALVVLLAWRPQWRQALLHAAAYGALSGLPIGLWAIFHNYPLSGKLLGTHQPAYPLGLLVAFIEKVASWFVPERILLIVPPLALFGLLLVLLAVRSTRQRWAAFGQQLLSARLLPAAAFTLVYGGMLVFAISYSEHRVPGSQRLHALLLPCLLALAAAAWAHFGPRLTGMWRTLALLAACLWLAFPLYRTAEYVRRSHAEGDVSYYNLYNTRGLRQSELAEHLSQLALQPEDKVYSNNEAAAWYLLRRQIYRLPRYDGETQASLEAALLAFDGWPASSDTAYMVWFGNELDYKRDVPTPEQMQAILPASTLRVLNSYRSGYGDVFILDTD
ncbi:MAG: glycosyltransferase family 39 protein [Anaerolineales bacterium]|nr:glycosyltransferase family 39 protein [Anaerolineales bacterium]